MKFIQNKIIFLSESPLLHIHFTRVYESLGEGSGIRHGIQLRLQSQLQSPLQLQLQSYEHCIDCFQPYRPNVGWSDLRIYRRMGKVPSERLIKTVSYRHNLPFAKSRRVVEDSSREKKTNTKNRRNGFFSSAASGLISDSAAVSFRSVFPPAENVEAEGGKVT